MSAESVDRPSRCSKSTGFAGVFQCTTAEHHQWKSMPSCPALVVATMNGQNGLLNACRTPGWLWRSPQAPDRPESVPQESDRSPDPVRSGLLSLFTRGHELGSGGRVGLQPVPDQPDLIFKEFSKPIPGVLADIQRLVESHDAVKGQLTNTNVDLCWPQDPQAVEEAFIGYVVPRVKDSYYFNNGRHKKIKRSLDWAVSKPTKHNLPFSVNDDQRTQLTWLVARFLDAMHTVGIAYGDVSWQGFSFQVAPEVRISVDGFDSARVVGRRPTSIQLAAPAVGWDDPHASGGEPVSFDTDRYQFALLAYRLLVSKDPDSSIDPTQIPAEVTQSTAGRPSVWPVCGAEPPVIEEHGPHSSSGAAHSEIRPGQRIGLAS